MEKVLITGANGSVGNFILKKFLKNGYHVIAADIRDDFIPSDKRVTKKVGDISNKEFVKSLFEPGIKYVVHTAAIIDITLPYEKIKGVNVDSVAYLYEAAIEHGVSKFVFFSSGSIYDSSSKVIKEDFPLKPLSPYEQSKIDGERIVKSMHKKGKTDYIIVRPALIYGPRGKVLLSAVATVPPLIRLFSKFAPKIAGGPLSNPVHSEDVARAVFHLTTNDRIKNETFNIADNTPITFGDFFNIAMDKFGLILLPMYIPYPPAISLKMIMGTKVQHIIFKIINSGSEFLWKKIVEKYGLKSELSPRLDEEAISYGLHDTIFDNSKLRATGFKFKFPSFELGFENTLAWYQKNRWVPTIDEMGG